MKTFRHRIHALLIVSMIACPFSLTAQSTRYKITYSFIEFSRQALKGDDSMHINMNGKSILVPLTLPDSLKIEHQFLTCEVVGDNHTAKLKYVSMYKHNPTSARTIMHARFFVNGKWSINDTGSAGVIPFHKATYERTPERKRILGYDCEKYVVRIENGVEMFEAWVAPQLPHTLVPVVGFAPLKGAILELYTQSLSGRFVAKHIESID